MKYLEAPMNYFSKLFLKNDAAVNVDDNNINNDELWHGAYFNILEIFKHCRIIDGTYAKSVSTESVESSIDYLFNHIEYLKNVDDSATFKSGLKEEFNELLVVHNQVSENDNLIQTGNIVEVKQDDYVLPRVAEITSVHNNNTCTIKFVDMTEKVVNTTLLTPHIRDYLSFYYTWKNMFPHWYRLMKVLAIFQPSSAAAERVFSQLAMFNKQQYGIRQENIWVTCALRVHKMFL